MKWSRDRKKRIFTFALAAVLIGGGSTLWNRSYAQDEEAPAATGTVDQPAADAATSPETPAEERAAEETATAASEAATDPQAFNTTPMATSNALDTIWVMMAGFLVMFMQAGFALVEIGLTRAKNAVNIAMKNLLDFCFGSVAYWLVGFGIMFGNGGDWNGFWGGLEGMCLNPEADWSSIAWTFIPLDAKFFFQLVFAATTATIVSGAMAERTKFASYMLYSVVVTLVIYPISGHWIWGGGWLQTKGFWDFAGSTTVHSCGGWLALIGAFILGPRLGKFDANGKPKAMPGHNLIFVTLGVFILWLGWFGFNPGSTMAADAVSIAKITVNTNASGAVGAIFALLTARLMFGKWEATMALNGALAGLVGITAGCAWVSVPSCFLIGAVSGVLVVLSVVYLEKLLKIDDPVGAVSVHGVCGAWGTLAIGLFSEGGGPSKGLFFGGGIEQFGLQALGVGAMFAWTMATGGILFLAIKYTVGLRVSAQEEAEGLDYGEHGNEAYHGFQFVAESHS